MRIGRLDVEPFEGDRIWVGSDPMFGSGPVLVRASHKDDVYVYAEARLVGLVGPDSPFKLIDIFLDEKLAMAGYVMSLPGGAKRLDEALTGSEPINIARAVARGLSILHRAGIAYRRFDRGGSFLVAGDCGIPYNFSRASRLGERGHGTAIKGISMSDEISEPGRKPMTYDPPEAAQAEYDGVLGDIYGLGILFNELGLDRTAFRGLLELMMDPDPRERPQSADSVLRKLDTERSGGGDA